METLSPFVLPLICLLWAIHGLFQLTAPERRLRRSEERRPRKGNEAAEPDGAPGDPAEASVDGARIRRIRRAGALWLALGAGGVWASGLRAGLPGTGMREWSSGGSAGLHEAVRKRCLPFLDRKGGTALGVAAAAGPDHAVMAFGREALNGSPATGDTLFEIGSITKVFTGIALAREVERGSLRLDQPVQELLPPGVQLPEKGRGITLRHLTSHTSGLPRLPENLFSPVRLVPLLFGGDPYRGYTEQEFLDAVRRAEPAAPPGTKFEYSNFGTALLGYLLARRSGTDYETYIRRTVLEPLGMRDTTVALTPEQRGRFARGYLSLLRLGPAALARRSAPWELASHLAGAGGLRSSAADMQRFLLANMAPGADPLGRGLRLSHREVFRENERQAVGMNWMRTRRDGPGTVVWHNGGTGGFFSFAGFTEDGRAGVVVLSNRAVPVDELGITLLTELHGRPAAAGG